MRVPTIVLLMLATAVVSFPGCKARGKSGAVSDRVVSRRLFRRAPSERAGQIRNSLATRGTDQCDCYTCRLKRETFQEDTGSQEALIEQGYTLDQGYNSIEFESGSEFISTPQPISNVITDPVNQSQTTLSEPVPAVQEIQGELIQDFELTNELPAEPELEINSDVPALESSPKLKTQPTPALESVPELISPKTSLKTKTAPKPEIQSNPIKAQPVSAPVRRSVKDSIPLIKRSVFRLKTRDDSVLETDQPEPQPKSTIWFAPTAEPVTEPIFAAPTEEVEPQPSQPVTPTEVSAPVIEHEIKEAEAADKIVLTARPVDHHMIYNSRQPTHAPMRQARLMTDSHFVTPVQQPRNTQLQFYPLPTQQPSHISPAPAAAAVPTQLAPAPVQPQAIVNPQSKPQLFQPVAPPMEEPAELRLKATVVPSSSQPHASGHQTSPKARLITSNGSMLTLNASPTDNDPQQLPVVAKFRRQQPGKVVVGSLQPSQGGQQTAEAGLQRLHTTPWQPMETGQAGSGQIHQSIRQLIIRPQQEANFSTDGIHR